MAVLPEITPYNSEILAALMFEGDGECYNNLLDRIIEVADLAQTAILNAEDETYDLDAIFEKDVTILPGQILFFLLEARALPEYDLKESDVKSFFQAVLISHNDSYQSSMRDSSLREAKEGLYLDPDVAVEIILNYPVSARLNYINIPLGVVEKSIYFPPTPLIKTDDAREQIEDGVKEALTKTLLHPDTIADFKDHPDWLLICPPRMLKKSFLRANPQFEAAALEALGVTIFMRICAQMGFDDILTTKAFLPLWARYFEEKKAAINNENPALLQAIQTIWAYENKGIPPSLLRILGNKPVEIQTKDTADRVTPIVEAPETNYGSSQAINCRIKNRQIEISTAPWPDNFSLHLVVRGVAKSRRTQNTIVYCFSSWEDLQAAHIDKPQNYDFQVTGFLCDRANAFSNANSMAGVPDEFWCEINKVQDPEPISAAAEDPLEEDPSSQFSLPDDLRTPLLLCEPCVAAMALANELDWQTHLAEQLIDYLDKFENLFEVVSWDGDFVTFTPRVGTEIFNALEPFTVDANALKITEPVFRKRAPDLDEELMELLVSWAQAKKEQHGNDEKLKRDRQEVADWRQANPFRQAKGTACRKALSFRPWEDYQSGTHKGPQGLEIPLYAWDKACVLRTYMPKIKHLLAQLEKAGMKTSYDKGLLESKEQRDVVLDKINFEIPETGLKFSLKINREAESSSEIFQLEFDDSTPEPWRNEAARWAIGTVCMMGIITLPKDKSPLVDGKTDRPNDVSHFSFKADPKRRRNSKEKAESTSSYGNIVTRLNEGRGRVKSIANGRGFDWNASWTDFSDAGQAVFQNAFFREDSRCDASGSQADYELILKDERWQKYAVLRLWKTLKLDQKIGDLAHRSSIGPYSKNMTAVAEKAWRLISKEDQSAFISIDSPTAAAEFTFKHGESENVNFIRTLASMWQEAGIGLYIQKEPIYVTFDTVAQHCQREGVTIIARSQEDLDALEELGLPDLKIKKTF